MFRLLKRAPTPFVTRFLQPITSLPARFYCERSFGNGDVSDVANLGKGDVSDGSVRRKDDSCVSDLNEKIICVKSQNEEVSKDKLPKHVSTGNLPEHVYTLHKMLSKARSGVLTFKAIYKVQGMIISSNTGSGFLLSRTMAASNAHVFCQKFDFEVCEGVYVKRWVTATVILAYLPDGEVVEVEVEALDTVNDLALLKLPTGMVKEDNFISNLGDYDLYLGQRLFFIGSPGFSFCIKFGNFSSIRMPNEFRVARNLDTFMDPEYLSDSLKIFELEGIAAPGTSGCPLFDECGCVVGVIFAGLDDIQKDAGAVSALAIPIRYLNVLVDWQSKRKSGESIFVHGESAHDDDLGDGDDDGAASYVLDESVHDDDLGDGAASYVLDDFEE